MNNKTTTTKLNNYTTYTKKDLLTIIESNNIIQPKAKYSNKLLINMLANIPDKGEVSIESTRSNNGMINRGSLCEMLVKMYVLGKTKMLKSECNEADLDTSALDEKRLKMFNLPRSKNIEIKFSTSFAYASPKSNKAHYTIVCNDTGAYLVESGKLAKNKSNHIIAKQPNGVLLKNLSMVLGY